MAKYYAIPIAFIVLIFFPMAYGSEETDFQLTREGIAVINLQSHELNRMVHAYVEFTNFDLNDKYFLMKIVNSETNFVTAEYKIFVGSTSTGPVDFNSVVFYVVTDEALENDNIQPGKYNMQISTKDGSLTKSVQFLIVDIST